MNAQSPTTLTTEVAVIGGGVGGLAASVALARSLRDVIVIDAGQPRNSPSAHAHNVLGHEGINPLDLVAAGRKEAEGYGIRFLDARVDTARRLSEAGAEARASEGEELDNADFELATSTGVRVRTSRIIIATGLSDELPDIPGLADGWGDTVLHCPYCHGYEVRGQNIGIIGTTAMSYHQAMMFSQLSDRVTFIRHNAPEPDAEQENMLGSLGIGYVDAAVDSVSRTDGGTVLALRPYSSADGSHDGPAAASAGGPADGPKGATAGGPKGATAGGPADPITQLTFDALAVGPYFRANGEIFSQLGGTVVDHPSGMGSYIPTEMAGQTQIPGVWAVGNSSDVSAMVTASAASGVLAGAHVNADLIMSRVSPR